MNKLLVSIFQELTNQNYENLSCNHFPFIQSYHFFFLIKIENCQSQKSFKKCKLEYLYIMLICKNT